MVNNRLAMAVLCWMVLVPLVSSAAIGQTAASKKGIFIAIASAGPPKTTVGFRPATDEHNAPSAVIECYCNLKNCGDRKHCTTGYGCFSELQPVMSDDAVPTTTAAPTMSQDFDDEATTFVFSNHTSNGSFGCLDMLSVNKTCDQILKSMEGEDSEFPTLPHQVSQDNVVRAFHCCQENMCNDPSHVAAKTVHESLAAVIRNSMSQLKEEQPAEAALLEPLSPADLHVVNNASNDAETVQTKVVPDDSAASTKPTATGLPSTVKPSATDFSTTESVTTTTDLVGDENATTAPVTAGSVDYKSKIVSRDVADVSYDSTVMVSASTEHVTSTSTVSSDSSNVHSTTEVPVAVTVSSEVDSSGNVTEATQSTTMVGSSGNVTEATQSTATAEAVAAAVVDGFATDNGLTTNLISETTVIAETSTIEIATTTKGSAEQKTPIADASDAAHVILTHDKVSASVDDTATINSDVAPQHGGNSHAETSALKSHQHEPLEVDNNIWRKFIGLDPTGIYVIICFAFGLMVAMFRAYQRNAGVSGTYKGVRIHPDEPCACGRPCAKTAATALYGIGTCAGCVGSSKYVYTAIRGPVRH